MAKYYVNETAQLKSGDHEVHKEGCTWLALVINKKYLGEFYSCSGAVQEAKKSYLQSNGCYYCSNECHTS